MKSITLADVLRTLDAKADVMVMLSSYTEIDFGDGDICKRQDGCGNHFAESWLEAINSTGCNLFVKSVTVKLDFERVQYIVSLENKKSYFTDRLSILANEISLRKIFLS